MQMSSSAADVPVLRVRAEKDFASRILSDHRLRLPLRSMADVEPGAELLVEVSFGALADPVELSVRVESTSISELGSPTAVREATVAVARVDHHRFAYVKAVVDGHREASARAHMRVPASFPAQWSVDGERRWGHVADISRGGAFIRERRLPEVGEQLELTLKVPRDDQRVVVQVASRVAWVRCDGPNVGFGVEFRVTDRGTASQIDALVELSTRATDDARAPRGP